MKKIRKIELMNEFINGEKHYQNNGYLRDNITSYLDDNNEGHAYLDGRTDAVTVNAIGKYAKEIVNYAIRMQVSEIKCSNKVWGCNEERISNLNYLEKTKKEIEGKK